MGHCCAIGLQADIVTDCGTDSPRLETVNDPTKLEWNEIKKVDHYTLSVSAATRPMLIREERAPYRTNG